MRIVSAFLVFLRLYGFHRRGGKHVAVAILLSLRAFDREFI